MCPLFKRNLRRFEQRHALVQPACCAGRRQTPPLRPADNTWSTCSSTPQRWRPFLHKAAACTSIYIGRRWQSTRKNPHMNRPLCLLMLVLAGCDVPQDTASVVEITAAKPDSIAAPAAQGRRPSAAPTTTRRTRLAPSTSSGRTSRRTSSPVSPDFRRTFVQRDRTEFGSPVRPSTSPVRSGPV